MNKQEGKYLYTASLMDEALLLLLEQKEFDAIVDLIMRHTLADGRDEP